MGKCGAITRKGTPCKLPARENGRCWLHADQQDLSSQTASENSAVVSRENFDLADKKSWGYASNGFDVLAQQVFSGPDEELSLDLLGVSDLAFWEQLTANSSSTSGSFPPLDPEVETQPADSALPEEELSFEMLDTPEPAWEEDDFESDAVEAFEDVYVHDQAPLQSGAALGRRNLADEEMELPEYYPPPYQDQSPAPDLNQGQAQTEAHAPDGSTQGPGDDVPQASPVKIPDKGLAFVTSGGIGPVLKAFGALLCLGALIALIVYQ